MKSRKLMLGAFCAAMLATAGLVGCEEDGLYKVNAPSDLQDRIDAIADANAAANSGDTTNITISTIAVGAKNCSAVWWTEFSDYFQVPAGKKLQLVFDNFSSGANNWNNWNLAVANGERDSDGYGEYFVIRSDNYGWGGSLENGYDAALLSVDYFDEGKAAEWGDWLAVMNGAKVTMEIDHSAMGPTYVTVSQLGTDGKTYTEKFTSEGTTAAPIYAWLVCDGSYLEIKKAFLVPSEIKEIPDELPVSIAVTGAPSVVEIGNTDFWGNAVATVTYADGTSEAVDTADVTFVVVPDMATLGTKTVTLAYSKSKQGAFCQAVATFYTLNVVNPVVGLEVTAAPVISKYYYFNEEPINFAAAGIEVTAKYADGTTGVMNNASLSFSQIDVAAEKPVVTISYVGASSTVTVDYEVELVKGTSQVGANDYSTGWWAAFTEDQKIESGASYTFKMYVYSDNLANFHSPCTILRKADLVQYGVCRQDHFGWGDGYDATKAESDWNWDTFASNINGSYVEITVTNNGDNTATVNYDVTYANGEKHFQKYVFTVDSADLQAALVTEESYLVMVE